MRSADGPSVWQQFRRTLALLAIEWLAVSLVVILLVVWPVCIPQSFAQNPQPDNQTNIVRGTVVNALTGQPIGRALVYSPDNRYATFTDGEGHFEFTLPNALSLITQGSLSRGTAETSPGSWRAARGFWRA